MTTVWRGYQLRKRDDHGTVRWEAWFWQKVSPWNRTEYQKLGESDSQQEAMRLITEHTAPHYGEVQDYDEKGHRVFWSW